MVKQIYRSLDSSSNIFIIAGRQLRAPAEIKLLNNERIGVSSGYHSPETESTRTLEVLG